MTRGAGVGSLDGFSDRKRQPWTTAYDDHMTRYHYAAFKEYTQGNLDSARSRFGEALETDKDLSVQGTGMEPLEAAYLLARDHGETETAAEILEDIQDRRNELRVSRRFPGASYSADAQIESQSDVSTLAASSLTSLSSSTCATSPGSERKTVSENSAASIL